MKIFLVALLVVASYSASAQESVLLRLNYTEGDKYALVVEMDQGMGMQGNMNMSMTMAMNVTEVSKKEVKTESKITAIKMDMMQGGMAMQFDSEKEADVSDPIGQTMKAQFEPMMEATIYNILDRMGNTIESRVEPAIPGMEQISGSSSNIGYPEKEVSVGSTWTSENENQGLIMNTHYTVTSIANGVIVLDISGEVSGVGTGTINGKTNIDIQSGVQTNSALEMNISAGGMDMSMKTNTTMTKV